MLYIPKERRYLNFLGSKAGTRQAGNGPAGVAFRVGLRSV